MHALTHIFLRSRSVPVVPLPCPLFVGHRRTGWSLASVLSEYEMFMDPDGGLSDMTFMETFQTGEGAVGGTG